MLLSLTVFVTSIASIIGDRPTSYCRPTEAQMEGPYYLSEAPPLNESLCSSASPALFRLYFSGQILSADDCTTPITAKIEAWQANENGNYSHFQGTATKLDCRATLSTDAQGRFSFLTTFPGRYEVGFGQYRPAHIHFRITPDNNEYGKALTTQVYFAKDAYLGAENLIEYSTVILSLMNRHDTQTFETEWFVYIRRGGNDNWDYCKNGGSYSNGIGGKPMNCAMEKAIDKPKESTNSISFVKMRNDEETTTNTNSGGTNFEQFAMRFAHRHN